MNTSSTLAHNIWPLVASSYCIAKSGKIIDSQSDWYRNWFLTYVPSNPWKITANICHIFEDPVSVTASCFVNQHILCALNVIIFLNQSPIGFAYLKSGGSPNSFYLNKDMCVSNKQTNLACIVVLEGVLEPFRPQHTWQCHCNFLVAVYLQKRPSRLGRGRCSQKALQDFET